MLLSYVKILPRARRSIQPEPYACTRLWIQHTVSYKLGLRLDGNDGNTAVTGNQHV